MAIRFSSVIEFGSIRTLLQNLGLNARILLSRMSLSICLTLKLVHFAASFREIYCKYISYYLVLASKEQYL